MLCRPRVVTLVIALLLLAARGFAQNEGGLNNFDFSLPGARARAMGGAFVAIADDATSAYSNPGGLTLLFRPEVSAEGRWWRLTSRTIDRGHGFGPASGNGVDTIEGLVDKDFHADVRGLSFLSFVYPHDRWAFGVFRHQLARNRMNRQIEGPFFACQGGYRELDRAQSKPPYCEPHAKTDGVDREFPKIQSYDLDIHGTGMAFAYDVSRKISVGIAVQYLNFSVDATNTVFTARGDQKYLPANFADPANVEAISTQSGDDHAWAANAGVLWNLAPRWTVGASFRQGPTFTFSVETVSGQQYGSVPIVAQPEHPFDVPHTLSVGLLHKASDFWRLAFEYDRVGYHRLLEGDRNTSLFPGDPEEQFTMPLLRLNDANQFRFGVERLLLLEGGRVIALRGGVWYDPNHQKYFDADPSTGLPVPRWAVLLPRRDGSVHVSGGAGVTFRRHLQFDVAVDLSELIDTFAMSAVWRF